MAIDERPSDRARGGIDLLPGLGKTLRLSEVGICDRLPRAARQVVEQQGKRGAGIDRCNCTQIRQIVVVEGEDVREVAKVARANLAGGKVGYIQSVAASLFNGARVWWFADMPVTCPGRIDVTIEPDLAGIFAHGRLGER